jgi:hypothetical protein
MRLMRSGLVLLALGLAFAPVTARAEGAGDAAAAKPVAAKPAKPAKIPTKTSTKAKAGKGQKKAPEEASAGESKVARKIRPSSLYVTADSEMRTFNANAHVTAFPSHPGAVKKAFAQTRRDQLMDAEKAARSTQDQDRWHTVLFHLRALDASNDPEACFWRSLAFYRLGEMERAARTRQYCEGDMALSDEEARAASLQPMAAMPGMTLPGDAKPDPVINPNPYTGPPPAKVGL